MTTHKANYIRKATFAIAVLLLTAMAASSTAWARSATPPQHGKRIYDSQWLNINKWECPFYNDGKYGIDVTIGTGQAGGAWPQPYHNCYIFGAGLWFGSLKPNVSQPGKIDTLVTFGYNPNSGGTEMTPELVAHLDEGAGSPDDKIFYYPTVWPPSPRERWETGVPAQDSELIPYENFSLQDLWCAYSDVAPENHISPGKPQDIDIYQTVYAWNYPSNQDIFFIIYHVRNSGTDTLKRCFMGAVVDADVGDATDDMVGLMDSTYVPGAGLVQNVGYVGDNDNYEAPGTLWDDGTPGVFAYKFLESPKDTHGVSLGMTAFKKFTIDIDPVTDPAQYLTMAGFDYRTGVYSPYDSVDEAPADKRFIQCSGPFDLPPGHVEKLVVAAIGAVYGGANQQWASRPIDSLVHLAQAAIAAQLIYDQGWLLPGPPLSPNMTLVPGDNRVRIVWDNLPEVTPDPYWAKVASDSTKSGYDPKYRGYDFEGYVVYKSRNGSDWQIVAQCDLVDSITFHYPPGGDSALTPDSLWLTAADNGTYYSVLDTTVTNGFTYYYCVAAYDWNYSTTQWDSAHTTPIAWDTLILRSGIVSTHSTVPRWDAVNHVDPMSHMQISVGDATNPALRCSSTVVVPFQVTSDTYELRFLGPQYGGSSNRVICSYYVQKRGDTLLAVDTMSFRYTVGNRLFFQMPVFNGVALQCSLRTTTPARAHDSAYVINGDDYPGESLKVQAAATGTAVWAFRGSDYKIVWTDEPGYMTAKVYDVTNGGVEVPQTRFLTNQSPQANGWCLVTKAFNQPTDTLLGRTADFYICGGYFKFRPSGDSLGSMSALIEPGDTWFVVGHKSDRTAAYYNVLQLIATPGASRTDTSYALHVKVVPNPYIVFNGWERTTEERRVKFTHLPSECTIRIYTMAGDLVKTILHTDQLTQPLDQGGTETWDFINSSQQLIASGVYIWHVESEVGEQIGKLAFIH
jgi:hypothetical protein